MRRGRRRPVAADEREVLFAVLVVGGREHGVAFAEPLDLPRAVAAPPRLLPIGRIGTPEPEQQVLRGLERDVVGKDLERQDHDVDVEEEVKIDVRDTEVDRLAVFLERDARLPHVGAAHHLNRAFAVDLANRAS